MRGDVEKPVARHDPVLARAADPMVGEGLAGGQLDELDPGPAQHEILVRSPVSIASMVRHADLEEFLVGRTPPLDLAGPRIAPYGDARLAGNDQLARPHQSAGHEDVCRGVEAFQARRSPQPPAGRLYRSSSLRTPST